MSNKGCPKGRAIIFSSPSGAGKTTLINRVRKHYPEFQFSISATSRSPRPGEREGEHYYYLTKEQFKARVQNGDFLEWEEVFNGNLYGTLRSEVMRLWERGEIVIFDIDVKGAMNIKRQLGDTALSIFIRPPSLETLRERLTNRGTETPEAMEGRIKRAEMELREAERFDLIVVNDDLETAVNDLIRGIELFMQK